MISLQMGESITNIMTYNSTLMGFENTLNGEAPKTLAAIECWKTAFDNSTITC